MVRSTLPQLEGGLFLTDGGIETVLIHDDGFDLPLFASFPLIDSDEGRAGLREYFMRYARVARERKTGLVLESATWRSSPEWAEPLGYTMEALESANRRHIELLAEIKADVEDEETRVVISGCVGPRGDGYDPGNVMTVEEARAYHRTQIAWMADAGADLTTAITMTNIPEATGVVLAAKDVGIPVVISFTLETDGTLPTGDLLAEAIGRIDAATDGYAAYYMINCAHPTHFLDAIEPDALWSRRIRGIRANASKKSHAELDELDGIDAGDPLELGACYAELKQKLPGVNVLGGCCGTNHVHVEHMALACAALEWPGVGGGTEMSAGA